MALILPIVNQKGGVGKTTTTINLASYLAIRGLKTLLLDLDPQGNATSGLGFDKTGLEATIYHALIEGIPLQDCILETGRRHLALCPANIALAGAEVELVSMADREFILKKALETVVDDYDFILIDCPPSLGLLTLNALTAAHGVIIPVQAEYYALEGLTQLVETIDLVKGCLNEELRIFGVVVTMYDGRTVLSQEVEREVRQYFEKQCFETIIPRNIRLSEAPSHGKAIAEFDSRSKGGLAYLALAKEVMKRARHFGER